MLAYAANTRPLGRSESPRALVLIVAGHAVLLGALFMTKMEIDRTRSDPPDVIFVPSEPPPPPTDQVKPRTDPATSTRDRPPVIVPRPRPADASSEDQTSIEINPLAGNEIKLPYVPIIPIHANPVRVAPRFVTPDNLLRPPYPTSKLRAEEEASLRLRLSIDPRGRVIAVDPVGSPDPEFLAAARRHILKSWRYKPATEDGMAIASAVVITLKFRLDQA